jgi:peptidoglycan hydrolase FlgJ
LAINPPSDIVLGVANAADPQKLRAAAAQLARASDTMAASAGDPATPETDLPQPASWSPVPNALPAFDPQTLAAALQPATATQNAAAKKTPEAYKKFEAFLVQTFVESMLPSDAPEIFGSGTAGSVWKSMLAEHLANAMTKGDAFGIAERLAKRREGPGKAATPGVTAASGERAPAGNATPSAFTDTRRGVSTQAQSLTGPTARRSVG